MNARTAFERLLKRYGNTVTIRRNGRTEVTKAFVQPLRRQHRLYLDEKMIHAGRHENAYLVYYGDTAHRFCHGDRTVITYMEQAYTVLICDSYAVSGQEVYIRAVLAPKKDLKEDDYDVID